MTEEKKPIRELYLSDVKEFFCPAPSHPTPPKTTPGENPQNDITAHIQVL
jgi:hypothetical protein